MLPVRFAASHLFYIPKLKGADRKELAMLEAELRQDKRVLSSIRDAGSTVRVVNTAHLNHFIDRSETGKPMLTLDMRLLDLAATVMRRVMNLSPQTPLMEVPSINVLVGQGRGGRQKAEPMGFTNAEADCYARYLVPSSLKQRLSKGMLSGDEQPNDASWRILRAQSRDKDVAPLLTLDCLPGVHLMADGIHLSQEEEDLLAQRLKLEGESLLLVMAGVTRP